MKQSEGRHKAPVAMLGGAFDPVHYGHLRAAAELTEYLGLEELRFVPSANPPHRPAHFASAADRLAMLEAAVADYPAFAVDDRELRRAGPSWSVLTLEELRAEQGTRSVCMILGMDAFLGLPDWHRWEDLLGLAHIVVACRPGSTLPTEGMLADLLAQHSVGNPEDLAAHPGGNILVHEVTQLEISSSYIRARLEQLQRVDFLLPDSVIEIINTTGCYKTGNGLSTQEKGLHAE